MKKQFYLFSVLLGVALFVFLQTYFQYFFYYVEQSQLFLLSVDYWWTKADVMGGIAGWIAEAFVQFFAYPYMGALLTTLLVFLTALLTGSLLVRMSGSGYIRFMGWLPALAILWASLDFNYSYAGNIACLLCIGAGRIYVQIKRQWIRMTYGIAGILLLTWLAGAAFALFMILIFFAEITQDGKRKWSMAYPVVGIAVGVWTYFACLSDTFFHAFLPIRYYTPNLKVPLVVYLPWLFLLVLCVSACLMSKIRWMLKGKVGTIAWLAESFMLCLIAYWGVSKYGDWKTLAFMKLDYYSRTEQWNEIIQDCDGRLTNYLYMSLLGRALAEEGRLTDDLFRYDIRSEKGLGLPWNRTEALSVLLSDLFYTCGNTSLAQRMAFEGDVSAHGSHNVRMIQRLVQTNLIYGAYPVAEKYLRMLSQSPIYNDWAEKQKHYLYNDEAVEEDKELGWRRALLPSPQDTSQVINFGNEFVKALIIPIRANAEKAHTAFQYLAGYYLLARDMNSFVSLIDGYRETPALPKLPIRYQEALIVAFENNPEKWNEYGVEPSVIARYQEFKRQAIANRGNRGAANLLRRAYGDTYWFYVMYN